MSLSVTLSPFASVPRSDRPAQRVPEGHRPAEPWGRDVAPPGWPGGATRRYSRSDSPGRRRRASSRARVPTPSRTSAAPSMITTPGSSPHPERRGG